MGQYAAAGSYTSAVGITDADGYRIDVAELAWLIGHASRLTAARLEMLRSLQTALPRKDEGAVADLKDMLSQIIIMQTRLAGREESLDELLEGVVRLRAISHVALDESVVSGAAAEIVLAGERVQSKG